MKKALGILCLAWMFSACSEPADAPDTKIREGRWIFEMKANEKLIPFEAEISFIDSHYIMTVVNGKERITTKSSALQGDSIEFTTPYFASLINCKVVNDSVMTGYYADPGRGADYRLAVSAHYSNNESRFPVEGDEENSNFSGRWRVTFSPGTEESSGAIGLFQQNGSAVSGTFLTETGDYRYLVGNVSGNKMNLSAFDGSHVFLFESELFGDSIVGGFWSGNHFTENWVAYRNDTIQLRHPDSLTQYNDSNSIYHLSFLDLNGAPYSFSFENLRSKVLVLQILGSWCPNCSDESRLFSLLYDKYHKEGLEIIGVAYERMKDQEEALDQIRYFKESIGASYPILYGGPASKNEAASDFPMLSGITSFPTAIFVDRKGTIRKIHTGFYGPGTGSYYEKYKGELTEFIEILLNE